MKFTINPQKESQRRKYPQNVVQRRRKETVPLLKEAVIRLASRKKALQRQQLKIKSFLLR
jgi:hypothetical protein